MLSWSAYVQPGEWIMANPQRWGWVTVVGALVLITVMVIAALALSGAAGR